MATKSKKETSIKKIVDAVCNAGIVGAGGAGFPTHIKLAAKADIVIANGVECEPLLYHDKHVMEDYPDKLIAGLKAALETTGATEGVIAIKKKYKKAEDSINTVLRRQRKYSIGIFHMDDYYPAGDEQEIVREVTGKTVPPGQIPLAVGAVVSNVTTLCQVADALEGTPVTDRLLSIVGDTPKPCTISVPLGMDIGELLTATGNALPADKKIFSGGLMMGQEISPRETVTKTLTGLIILPADHFRFQEYQISLNQMKRRSLSACCQCQACMDICPRYLLGHPLSPHKNMRSLVNAGGFPQSASLCCECGLCTALVACPMGLSPRRVNQHIKGELAKQQQKGQPFVMGPEHPLRAMRRISSHRLKDKLQVLQYDVEPERYTASLPSTRLKISLKQHIGIPSRTEFSRGDSVKKGDVIGAIKKDKVGANVHASADGIIDEVTDTFVAITTEHQEK